MLHKKTPATSQPNKKSLAATLARNTLGISAFTLIVVSSLGMYFTFRSQRQAVGSQQALAAQGAASSVKSFVQDKSSTLHSAITFNYLAGLPKTNASSNLEKLLSLEPAFSEVALLDTNQKQVAQASRLPDLYANSITSRIDKNQLFQSVKQNKDYISQVYIDKASAEPEILIAVPINSVYTGFAGTLVAQTNLKFMWDLVGNIKDGNNGLAYVVDQHGALIAAGDTSRVLKRENLSSLTEVKQFLQTHNSANDSHTDISRGFKGTNVVSTYASLGTPDWAVITEIPVPEAYAPVVKSMVISIGLILVGVALAIIASIWYAGRLTKPIIELRDVVNRFGLGDLKAKIEVTSNDEIGDLGRAFNTMVSNLQTSTTKLHEERVKLEASINSLNVGFLMIDLDGNVMTNPVARTILSCTPDGKAGPAITPGDLTLEKIEAKLGPTIGLKTAVDQALQALQLTEHKAVDFNSHVLRVFIAPILQDSEGSKAALGAVVLMEDITETTIQERSKDEFFSIASHELRTPLTSIKGNSSMILDYYGDVLKDEKLREMVDDMHSSAVRLIEIVNDFLDISRLEQGKMNFTYAPVSVEKVVESVVYEMQSVLAEKKLFLKIDRLTLDRLPKVWVDENRLKQVVYNLVGNAAKFTEEGGITVSAELDPPKKFVKVLITDTGRGMTPDSQQLLFHKFQQASSSLLTRDTTRGTGLGLYISKMIIESMGGVIALVESIENKGTIFSFTVPVVSTEQLAALPTPANVTDSTTGLTTAGSAQAVEV